MLTSIKGGFRKYNSREGNLALFFYTYLFFILRVLQWRPLASAGRPCPSLDCPLIIGTLQRLPEGSCATSTTGTLWVVRCL